MLSAMRACVAYLRAVQRPPIYRKRNAHFHSRVFRVPSRDGDLAVKVVECSGRAARRLIFREHTFLRALREERVARYRGHVRLLRRYVLVTDWIDGTPLEAVAPADPHAFSRECDRLLSSLEAAGIRHRDIREKNIILSNQLPVLVDFGWAIWRSEHEPFTPTGLQDSDDVHAMSTLKTRILGTTDVAASR